MTVTATNRKNQFSTNGVTTEFTFGFAITDVSQVYALTVDDDGTETVFENFTAVKSEVIEGGTLTTNEVLSGVDLLIYRDTALTQQVDYESGGKFPADSHEQALDKLTLQNQDQQEELDRTLKSSISNDDPYTVGKLESGFMLASVGSEIVSTSITEGDLEIAKGNEITMIARSLNVLNTQVIYSTNTVTVLDDVLYIYDASEQITYAKPSNVGIGEVIVSVADGLLATDADSYTLYGLYAGQAETVEHLKILTPVVGAELSTKGYRYAGDGGGARYIILPTGSTVFPGYLAMNNGTVAALSEIEPNVLQFGADRSNSIASDTAFKNSSAYAADSAISKKAVKIPAGAYLLEESNSMKVNVTGTINGFQWEGAGLGVTVINFINSDPVGDNYLIDNQNTELRVSYRGIRFQGNPSDENSRFYRMESSGVAQSPRFFDCMWYQFYSIVDVTDGGGATNGSEPLFMACKTSNIYGPAFTCDNVQSLNWNFHGCDLEVHYSDVFKFTKGGVLNVWGGSIILFDHPTLGTSGNVISTNGSTANIGSNNWTYNFWGVRTELHGTSRLLTMSSAGKITFNECNLEVVKGDTTREIALVGEEGYVSINGGHVNGKFTLGGSSGSAWATEWRQATLYVQGATIGTNFDVNVTQLGNSGGTGRYKIRDCKKFQSGVNPTVIVDQDYGWELGFTGMATNSKFVVVGRQDGNLPRGGASESIQLPSGSRVVSWRLVHTAQAGANPLVYTLQNSDGSIIHESYSFASATAQSAKTDAWLLASDLNQTMVISADAANSTSLYNGYVVIEYI